MATDPTGPKLIFVGPFPPPLHGQSVATKALCDLLHERNFQVVAVDNSISPGQGAVRRLGKELKALCTVLTSRIPRVYASVNANRGIIATIMLCVVARLRFKKITLHHHSYRYIGKRDFLMSVLARVAGGQTLHVVNCEQMGKELAAQYSGVNQVQSYNNVGVVDSELTSTQPGDRPLALGHMSNLTEEKGLGRTIDAFRQARSLFPELKLHIAGPCADDFAEQRIAHAAEEFGDAFIYHGPAYGPAKKHFFDAIDVFVFPSLYAVETQGIVNLEALACGKPVVAFAQCCIAGDIGDAGGRAVQKSEDFSGALVDYLQIFSEAPEAAANKARERFDTIQTTHQRERDDLLMHLASGCQ